MKTRPDIDKKVEEALSSLDGIRRAEPAPFFYTRVIGRLQRKESVWEKAGSFIARPAVVTAGLVLILAVNISILFSQQTSTKTNTPVSSITEDLKTDNEYILASSSSFDYENLDPQ